MGAAVQHYAAGTLNVRMLFRKVDPPFYCWCMVCPPQCVRDYFLLATECRWGHPPEFLCENLMGRSRPRFLTTFWRLRACDSIVQAAALRAGGSSGAAAHVLRRILELEPNNSRAHFALGQVLP